jgi:hypothetical protein
MRYSWIRANFENILSFFHGVIYLHEPNDGKHPKYPCFIGFFGVIGVKHISFDS